SPTAEIRSNSEKFAIAVIGETRTIGFCPKLRVRVEGRDGITAIVERFGGTYPDDAISTHAEAIRRRRPGLEILLDHASVACERVLQYRPTPAGMRLVARVLWLRHILVQVEDITESPKRRRPP